MYLAYHILGFWNLGMDWFSATTTSTTGTQTAEQKVLPMRTQTAAAAAVGTS
jgi:hypothetical protein